MSIGDRLREYRKSKGMTQAELAEKAGISRSYYADIEKDYYNPSLETLKSISTALGVAPSAFLGDDTDLLTLVAVDNNMDAAYDALVNAKKEPATASDDELSGLDRELISMLCQLSPDDYRRVKDFVAGLKAAHEE